jgi:antitoxin VapB
MSLNIKNERVHALAREAARRTGKNQTSVIEEALENLLANLPDPTEDARRIDLIHEIQTQVKELGPGFLNTDWLYDAETGLPR